MGLFAVTNGYCASVMFSLVIKEVPKNLVGKSSSSLSLFKIMGILFGSIYALLITKNILV
jgi:hypothetical protein